MYMPSQEDKLYDRKIEKGFFITGTDTDSGKTVITCSLLYKLAQERIKAVGFKPLASGATYTPQGLRNEDALKLQKASHGKWFYSIINPLIYEPFIAPHLAAAEKGQSLSVKTLLSHCTLLTCRHKAQVVLVEGAGGWKVPLNDQETIADFALQLNYPVILVVGLRLGCLNHALLTYESILKTGLPLAGWVANCLEKDYLSSQGTIKTLQSFLGAPLLGTIPFQQTVNPALIARYLTFC